MKNLVMNVLAALVIVIGCFGFTVVSVYAFDPLETACTGDAQGSDFCKNKGDDNNRTFAFGNNNIFVKIIQTIVIVTGALSVVMIIVGGLKYIISAGDTNNTKQAKDTIQYAIIGLLVAIFAQTIVAFVLSKL